MKTRPTDELVFSIPREADVGSMSIKALRKKYNLNGQTFLRRRNKFGGLDALNARRLTDLESGTTGSSGCWPS